jgi:phosphate transport system substrate-binding protein
MRITRRSITGLAVCLAHPIRVSMAQGTSLRAGGTGMALASMRLIAERYADLRPGGAVELLPSLGTNGALRALAAGAIDLGLLARPLRAEEVAQGLRSRAYARTPIAVVTSGGTAATGITLAHFAAVLRGEVTTWPDGGRLRLVRREASDADWQLLASLSPEMERSVAMALRRPGLVTVGTDQENAEALQGIAGSIGLMSIGQKRAEGLRLRVLRLDGVAPEMPAVADGRYALARTLHMAWRTDTHATVLPFIDFVTGPDGDAVLRTLGYGPPEP